MVVYASFTAEQKAEIKALIEDGSHEAIVRAQAIILDAQGFDEA